MILIDLDDKIQGTKQDQHFTKVKQFYYRQGLLDDPRDSSWKSYFWGVLFKCSKFIEI